MNKKWIVAIVLILLGVGLIVWNLNNSQSAPRDTKEVEVTLDEVSAAVRATIERESAGGVIKEIEAEMDGNTAVSYEVDLIKGNEEIELEILPDGTVTERDSKPLKR